MNKDQIQAAVKQHFTAGKYLTVLTGAGISAESGIPTFRGPEGYWTIGSKVYRPQEMATAAMFHQRPEEVWKWYLHRIRVCYAATPNKGHFALVKLEEAFGDQFSLITQNVDGLHLRAGNCVNRTFQIHGNINYMRCGAACSNDIYPVPASVYKTTTIEDEFERIMPELICPKCVSMTRPHVLWFDESYNEAFYRFDSSLDIAYNTGILIVVGTSGATTLPNHVVRMVSGRGGLIIDVNMEANVFGEVAMANGGFALKGASGDRLPELSTVLLDCLNPSDNRA